MNFENLNPRQAKMFSMIENWQSSGMTQLSFCKEQQIAYGKFHYWLKRYGERHQEESAGEAFLPVKIKRALTPPCGPVVMELVLQDGRRLNFYQAVDASYLRVLLA